MRVSDATVRILREHTGRGATTARSMVDNHAVVVFLHDCLTKGENVLLAHEMDEQVLDLRRSFQETMRKDLVPAIEEIVGRKVTSFLSANSVEPDLMVEVFILGPANDDAASAANDDAASAVNAVLMDRNGNTGRASTVPDSDA